MRLMLGAALGGKKTLPTTRSINKGNLSSKVSKKEDAERIKAERDRLEKETARIEAEAKRQKAMAWRKY